MSTWLHGATELLDRYLEGALPVGEFCKQFEQMWNFERTAPLAPEVERLMSDLFDIIGWYTPIEQDRRRVGSFRDESDVLKAARQTRAALRETVPDM